MNMMLYKDNIITVWYSPNVWPKGLAPVSGINLEICGEVQKITQKFPLNYIQNRSYGYTTGGNEISWWTSFDDFINDYFQPSSLFQSNGKPTLLQGIDHLLKNEKYTTPGSLFNERNQIFRGGESLIFDPYVRQLKHLQKTTWQAGYNDLIANWAWI